MPSPQTSISSGTSGTTMTTTTSNNTDKINLSVRSLSLSDTSDPDEDHSSSSNASSAYPEGGTEVMPLDQPLNERKDRRGKVKRSSSIGFGKNNNSGSNHSKGSSRTSSRRKRKDKPHVKFDEDKVVIHPLPSGRLCDETRKVLWLTYQDKVTITDDVEELCYHFNCPDEVHPYVAHLDAMWDKSASSKGVDVFSQDEAEQLVQGKGRGLEKKLVNTGLKKNRDNVVKVVLDTQKTYRLLPVGSDQRAKLLKNKYKKLTHQSKVFARALAWGDQVLAEKINPRSKEPHKVVATSA